MKEEKERHLQFITNEFEKNEFLVADALGINRLILEELVEVIFSPSFEGRNATAGSIICSHPIERYKQNLPHCTWVSGVLSEGRIFSDGIKTFRVVTRQSEGVLSFSSRIVLDELDLFTIRDDALYKEGGEEHGQPLKKDIALIKRSETGEIILLCQDGIAVHRDARISFFRYQYDFKRTLQDYIVDRWGCNPWDKQVLDSLLRMSVHTLGAERGVGGTFVLFHPDDAGGDPLTLNTANAIAMPEEMDITLRDHQHLLAPLMKETDGAVLVEAEGKVRSARNWLIIPPEIMGASGSEGGTRHLTAKLFSTLIQGLVFVISSDGPVTIYGAGHRILRTCERR